MTIDDKHVARLLPDAKEMIGRSLEERIHYIHQDRWLPYTQADRLLSKFEMLLKMPRKIRPPSLLIVGDSHCGKSTLVRRFKDMHPPTDGVYESACPVFYLESCPPETDEGRLYDEILTTLMVPFRYNDRPDKKLHEVIYQFEQIQVQMIILDEIGHALSGAVLKQRVLLNALKALHNKMHVPIILVGTMEALYATSSDEQFASRFKAEHLPRWEYGNEFQRFLARLELTLPLSMASLLADPDLSKLIFERAESGCIGDFVDLVNEAAIMAINSGKEQITAEEIKGCDFTPSSKRQPPAERGLK
ncbi:ATP-binding protein [Geobacter hydrogenophilus]|uniref:Transposase n=1 Tax=Geobacter hydrogenophilus TaxID=40983 RepID=A0A9W6LCK8_9BACT|nr:TniB family NTP-binding protein [Geobacter hydrogenophilus]MBT0893757.1 ATP-binding protein [Geobacter hydrogenophilus]GLI37546.1 transposase [Geobacter hydrogenophilus]